MTDTTITPATQTLITDGIKMLQDVIQHFSADTSNSKVKGIIMLLEFVIKIATEIL